MFGMVRTMGAKPIPLRETSRPAAPAAVIIDANYAVVRRGSWARKITMALAAVAIAALLGMLVPPIWVAIEAIRANA